MTAHMYISIKDSTCLSNLLVKNKRTNEAKTISSKDNTIVKTFAENNKTIAAKTITNILKTQGLILECLDNELFNKIPKLKTKVYKKIKENIEPQKLIKEALIQKEEYAKVVGVVITLLHTPKREKQIISKPTTKLIKISKFILLQTKVKYKTNTIIIQK